VQGDPLENAGSKYGPELGTRAAQGDEIPKIWNLLGEALRHFVAFAIVYLFGCRHLTKYGDDYIPHVQYKGSSQLLRVHLV
jgi:hypothetical protein